MTNPEAARRLVGLFFLGQYLLALLLTPSLAAGAIAGEKERKSYEMLLASPLPPAAIVLGKLLASLCFVSVLLAASVPMRDAVPAAGRRVVLRSAGAVLGLAVGRAHGRHDQPGRQQLFRPHRRGAGRGVSADSAAGAGRAVVWMVDGARTRAGRLSMLAMGLPIVCLPICMRSCCCWSAGGCCIRPTSAAKARKWSTKSRKCAGPWAWSSSEMHFPTGCLLPPKRTDLLPDDSQSGVRQGNAERNLQPGHADAAAGDPGEHGTGAAADGPLLVLLSAAGALVHQLLPAVQHAGRAGVFGRQHHQRARTANAWTCCW